MPRKGEWEVFGDRRLLHSDDFRVSTDEYVQRNQYLLMSSQHSDVPSTNTIHELFSGKKMLPGQRARSQKASKASSQPSNKCNHQQGHLSTQSSTTGT
jgi:hypothetical protein